MISEWHIHVVLFLPTQHLLPFPPPPTSDTHTHMLFLVTAPKSPFKARPAPTGFSFVSSVLDSSSQGVDMLQASPVGLWLCDSHFLLLGPFRVTSVYFFHKSSFSSFPCILWVSHSSHDMCVNYLHLEARICLCGPWPRPLMAISLASSQPCSIREAQGNSFFLSTPVLLRLAISESLHSYFSYISIIFVPILSSPERDNLA